MRTGEARFLTAVARPQAYPPPQGPEVVLLGRSNVGKSSLINALTGRRGLARVSRTPGRTQQVNFFAADGLGTLVDLPGYGFARAPEAVRRAWKPLVDAYLSGPRPLALCLLLVDARHPPSEQDVRMLAWLKETERPTQVVLTKADALSGGQLPARREEAARALGLPEGAPPPLPVSARTGRGIPELRALVHRAVCP